jgi:redox-sensitive bicupin YhaK (pirin superfamily)
MLEPYPSRETLLGSLPIVRALPVRGRRLIGRWCFLDRYGPLSFSGEKAMDVGPHPHIGLQTVSWLLEGEVVHHDTLGCEAVVRPGGVNLMTSGRGIAHAEETPSRHGDRLSGVQLWIAMRDAERHVAPSFDHIAEVARDEYRGGLAQRFVEQPDLAGIDVQIHRGETLTLPANSSYEHGIFILDGEAELEGQRLDGRTLWYRAPGATELTFRSANGARVLLLGGVPFDEPVLMWWNFVARTRDEIAAARDEWQAGRFGTVRGYNGAPIDAPPLAHIAAPNPAS